MNLFLKNDLCCFHLILSKTREFREEGKIVWISSLTKLARSFTEGVEGGEVGRNNRCWRLVGWTLWCEGRAKETRVDKLHMPS